jgi:YihY family inner membrane protein
VGATGFLVLAVIGISTFAAFFSRSVEYLADQVGVGVVTNPSGWLVRDGLQLALIAVMTVMLYRFVPAERLGRRAMLVGALFTAVGIWGASKLLVILLDFTRYNVIYGSLAGVMTFLLFVYVVALILLLGAELAYAWSLPPGPPGPPLRRQITGFLRGLVAHPEPPDGEQNADEVSAEDVRKTRVR